MDSVYLQEKLTELLPLFKVSKIFILKESTSYETFGSHAEAFVSICLTGHLVAQG